AVLAGVQIGPAGVAALDIDADAVDAVGDHVVEVADVPLGDGIGHERVAAAQAPQVDLLAPQPGPVLADLELPGGHWLVLCRPDRLAQQSRDQQRQGAARRHPQGALHGMILPSVTRWPAAPYPPPGGTAGRVQCPLPRLPASAWASR